MVKHKIEALLFSSGRKMSVDEISKLCKQKKDVVIESLKELKNDYEQKNSSLMVVEEGDYWKITVREQHVPLVRNIVTETELSRSVIETLAVIAFEYPILQSKLIKIRTNKAYDHLKELEEAGYITRQKHGRSKLIKLTQKFFEYFDLQEGKLKEHLEDFKSIAKAIEEREEEIKKIKDEQKKKADDAKKEDEKIKKEIIGLDNLGDLGELKVVDMSNGVEEGKLGQFDIVDEPEKAEEVKEEAGEEQQEAEEEEKPAEETEMKEEEKPETEEGAGEEKSEEHPVEVKKETEIDEEAEEQTETEEEAEKPKMTDDELEKEIKKPLPPEMEKRVEKEIDKMIHPPKEGEEEKPRKKEEEAEEEEKTEEDEEKESEEKDLLEAEMENGEEDKEEIN